PLHDALPIWLGRERVNARTQRVRVQFSSAMRCVKIFILLAIFTPRDYIFTSADYSHAKRSEVQKPGLVLGPVATSRKMGVRANGFWCRCMATTLNVLVIEDSEEDTLLMVR